ncbi:uncharacterized protein EDB91DRAFT_707350 [Suillus paluster]|uniref:uncharacterized protein n=1 Tax=Suillus paluster TaxID=48578 RepID=UPI001B86F678|nr:uncharacterized protein EDB91DRAFT_707350 [Suillus paluster]KAG1731812.1 hypothetical protein EDB91DRAFT_707350 [Suillus paluster]
MQHLQGHTLSDTCCQLASIMIFKSLVIVAAAALAVNAQTSATTSPAAVPSGLTECIISCSAQAASAGGCSSYTDLACVCTSTAFQDAAAACLQANCTTAEIAAADQAQISECSSLSGNATTSSATPSATSPTTSATSSTTSSASSTKTSGAATSGAAAGLVPSFALNSPFGGLVALAGALSGSSVRPLIPLVNGTTME